MYSDYICAESLDKKKTKFDLTGWRNDSPKVSNIFSFKNSLLTLMKYQRFFCTTWYHFTWLFSCSSERCSRVLNFRFLYAFCIVIEWQRSSENLGFAVANTVFYISACTHLQCQNLFTCYVMIVLQQTSIRSICRMVNYFFLFLSLKK